MYVLRSVCVCVCVCVLVCADVLIYDVAQCTLWNMNVSMYVGTTHYYP
jgi:hypothetical protein